MKPEDPLVDMHCGQTHAAYQSHQDWAGGRGLGITKKFSVGTLLQVKADRDTHNLQIWALRVKAALRGNHVLRLQFTSAGGLEEWGWGKENLKASDHLLSFPEVSLLWMNFPGYFQNWWFGLLSLDWCEKQVNIVSRQYRARQGPGGPSKT